MARRRIPGPAGGGGGGGGADPGGTGTADGGVGAVDSSRIPARPDRVAAERNIMKSPTFQLPDKGRDNVDTRKGAQLGMPNKQTLDR